MWLNTKGCKAKSLRSHNADPMHAGDRSCFRGGVPAGPSDCGLACGLAFGQFPPTLFTQGHCKKKAIRLVPMGTIAKHKGI